MMMNRYGKCYAVIVTLFISNVFAFSGNQKEIIKIKAINSLKFYVDAQCMDKGSKFYGCNYKKYWMQLTDKPDARFQEVAYYYAYIYRKFDIKEGLERSIAAIEFWCSLQIKNGLFPEFPASNASIAATAFGINTIGRAIMLLGDEISPIIKIRVISTIENAFKYFLDKDFDNMLIYGTNQKLGVLAALTVGYCLTNNPLYLDRYRILKEWILSNEVDSSGIGLEGANVDEKWYDYSYVELLMWFLIYKDTGDVDVFKVGSKLASSLTYLIDPGTGKSIVGRSTTGVHALLAWANLLNNGMLKTIGEKIFIPSLIDKKLKEDNRYVFSMWWEIFPIYEGYPEEDLTGVFPLTKSVNKNISIWKIISSEDFIVVYHFKEGITFFKDKGTGCIYNKFHRNVLDNTEYYDIIYNSEIIGCLSYDLESNNINKYKIF